MTSHLSLNPFITAYAQGKDTASSLGPHRQQPGQSILDNHPLYVLDARGIGPDKFAEFQKVFFTGWCLPKI